MSQKKLTSKTARELLWRAGDLSYLLHPAQKDMKAAFDASSERKFIICTSRQLGKSYFLCVLAVEMALKKENADVKIAAPTKVMSRSIIQPHMRSILKDCPQDIRPEWWAQGGLYRFHNGSTIAIAGMDAGNIERLRGTKADLFIFDEASFASDLKYAVADVALPMTITTGGKILIASTPPKTPRHDFENYWLEAQKTGNFCHKTIYQNPFVGHKQLQEFITESGGESSTTWKREYLAEFCFDEDSLVIPEFNKEKQQKIVREVERPAYFDAYTALDPGYTDLTATLFGYYDFLHGKIVIEDEFVLDKIRTDILATGIIEKETNLWGKKKPYFRVCDAEPILIRDLAELHDLQFIVTDRDNKAAAINEVRMAIQSERIIIHPRCRTLISHLECAIWDNSHEKFARVTNYGHFDCIDALIYFVRNIRKLHNPYPSTHYSDTNMHVTAQNSDKSQTAKVLERVFKVRKFTS